MRYKRVRSMDIDFSVIGFGCWQASGDSSWTAHTERDQIEAMDFAIDNGVNFFDTAPVYGLGGSEIVVGKALKNKRDRVIIATKCGLPWSGKRVRNDVSKKSILKEIDESLSRLQTDFVDIYQVHWPSANEVPLEETMEAMRLIKESGKARYIGITNYSVSDLELWCQSGLVSAYQGLYNIAEKNSDSYHGIPLGYQVQKEIFPIVRKHNLAFFPFSPLMQGLLADRFQDSIDLDPHDVRFSNAHYRGTNSEKILKMVSKIKDLFVEGQIPMNQISLSMLLDTKEITSIIAGVRNRSQLANNLKSLELTISSEIKSSIEEIISQSIGN